MNGIIDLAYDSDEGRLQAVVEESLKFRSSSGSASRSGDDVKSSSDGSSFSATGTVPSKRQVPQQAVPESHNREKRTRNSSLRGYECRPKPPLFRLLSSPNDTPSVGSVELADLLSGDFHEALLTNFMVDPQFLMDAQPRLRYVPWVLVCGDADIT